MNKSIDNIIPINKDQPVKGMKYADPNVIERLEHTLDLARAGEITGFACVVSYADFSTGTQHGGCISYSMVGQLEHLKAIILKELEEE